MIKKQKRKRSSSKKKSLGKFKSAIEKYCSDQLRERGVNFTYETKEFVLMESFRFTHKYFKMTAKKKEMSNRTDSVQHPIRYTIDNGLGYDVFLAKNKRQVDQSIDEIIKSRISEENK